MLLRYLCGLTLLQMCPSVQSPAAGVPAGPPEEATAEDGDAPTSLGRKADRGQGDVLVMHDASQPLPADSSSLGGAAGGIVQANAAGATAGMRNAPGVVAGAIAADDPDEHGARLPDAAAPDNLPVSRRVLRMLRAQWLKKQTTTTSTWASFMEAMEVDREAMLKLFDERLFDMVEAERSAPKGHPTKADFDWWDQRVWKGFAEPDDYESLDEA
eukprot:TRINITY_DN78155_c0_g1_i1.p2 TRINITY_DN78155_c0_g1~~TRINITY_DN78155_c0_g1_i1.p2  ORF type:complete len:214 (-),score=54.36 TRINITY_DN78155_c0_g1_i1:4-645(-)